MKKLATSKQTGQGGTSFEDKVVAYFLSCMLAETLPFDSPSGLIQKIDLQVTADGWLFDDILVTLETSQRRVAISVKSNRQFSANGCPADINRQLWEQVLRHSSSVFNKETDRLCLVEAPISPAVSANLNQILEQAANQNASTLHHRILTPESYSNAMRKIYRSFYCPRDLSSTYSVKDEDTADLLTYFMELQMDFESRTSRDEARAIDYCRNTLRSKNQADALDLYRELCLIPRKLAPLAGSLDRKRLVKLLQNKFALTDAPRYESDWRTLENRLEDKLSIIPSTLGESLALDRSSFLPDMEDKLTNGPGLIIRGISGSGKTNLAKRLAEKKRRDCSSVVWLDSTDFDSESIESAIKLEYPLSILIETSANTHLYLFMDGTERLYNEGQLQRLAVILKKALDATANCKVIFTCPSDQTEKLNGFLTRFHLPVTELSLYDIPALGIDELIQIAKAYPRLEEILFTDSMENIRNNLKLLDKLIVNSNHLSTVFQARSFGESELVDFVWAEEIENTRDGLQNGAFLKELAEQQADNLSSGVSLTLFTPDRLAPADRLRTLGFLLAQNEKLYFSHDLYSDWARYRLLKSHRNDLAVYLSQKHLTSPFWAKAARLYGVSLLEQDATGSEWQKFFQSFNATSPQQVLIQDLLLEAFFFSPGALSLLQKHKQILFEDKGRLMIRMLKLFLVRATQPDPRVLALGKQIGISERQASALERMPIPAYWPAFLQFLEREVDAVLANGLLGAVQIAALWLEKTPTGFPFRSEAATVCVTATRQIMQFREKGHYVDEEIEEPVYRALLLSYMEHPEQVRTLSLRIAKRIKPDPSSEADADKIRMQPTQMQGGRGFRGPKSAPWLLGPLERVNSTFRKVCLESRALFPILQHAPSLGSELLCAVLIEEPKDQWHDREPFNNHYEITPQYEWYPPFFLRGPFLSFLRLSQKDALLFVSRLTDFATDRWLEGEDDSTSQRAARQLQTVIEGEARTFIGDFTVFGWHKGAGQAPHSLVSVLMALEQFLYEQLESKQSIDDLVAFLLANTRSIAIVGTLFTVSKSYLPLLLNHLKPFLSWRQVYEWDFHSQNPGLLGSGGVSSAWAEQEKYWREKHIGKPSILYLVIQLLLQNEEFQHFFAPIRENWQVELSHMKSHNERDVYLIQLIPQTDPANYKQVGTGRELSFQYQEPAEVTDDLAAGRKASQEAFDDSPMAFDLLMPIDQTSSFGLSEAEMLWQKIQNEYAKVDPDSDSHCSGEHAWGSRYTRILAAVKGLVAHKKTWVDRHNDYLEWMVALLEKLINIQFASGQEFRFYGTDHDWNIHLAEIAAMLWIEDRRRNSLRKIVAGVLVLFNPNTTKHFFVTASAFLPWNDPDFIQAQNLLLQYSGGYDRLARTRDRDPSKLMTLRNELSAKFVQEQIPANVLESSTVRSPEEWISKETDNWRRGSDDRVRRPGLTTEILHPLLETLPVLSTVKNSDEFSYVRQLLKQAYDQVIYQLGEIKDNSLPIRSQETEFERTVLKNVAGSILYVQDKELKRQLWEPLLRYGYVAAKQVETFCNSYFLNLGGPAIQDDMVATLNEMIEYTYSSPTWETKNIDRGRDFRICVSGFHPWIVGIWKDDYSSFTAAAEGIYKKWFVKNRMNPYAIDPLLDFIITSSGKFMIHDGLQILAGFFNLGLYLSQQKAPEGKVYVGHPDLDDKLALTMTTLWDGHADLLRSRSVSFAFYRELIQYLIAIQNLIGIELQHALMEE